MDCSRNNNEHYQSISPTYNATHTEKTVFADAEPTSKTRDPSDKKDVFIFSKVQVTVLPKVEHSTSISSSFIPLGDVSQDYFEYLPAAAEHPAPRFQRSDWPDCGPIQYQMTTENSTVSSSGSKTLSIMHQRSSERNSTRQDAPDTTATSLHREDKHYHTGLVPLSE